MESGNIISLKYHELENVMTEVRKSVRANSISLLRNGGRIQFLENIWFGDNVSIHILKVVHVIGLQSCSHKGLCHRKWRKVAWNLSFKRELREFE